MFIKSAVSVRGITEIVIAGDAGGTELLRISDKGYAKFCAGYIGSENPDDSVLYELDESGYDALHRLADNTGAVLEAARILSGGDKNERELRMRLKRKFPDEAADHAILLMKRRGYLNEDEQCRRLAEYAAHSKRHGPSRIRSDLMARGYSRRSIDDAISAIPDEDFEEALAHIVEKKYGGRELSPDERRRAAASLMRLGFSYGMIKDKLK